MAPIFHFSLYLCPLQCDFAVPFSNKRGLFAHSLNLQYYCDLHRPIEYGKSNIWVPKSRPQETWHACVLSFTLPFPWQYEQCNLLKCETCRTEQRQPSSNSQDTRHMKDSPRLTECPRQPTPNCRCVRLTHNHRITQMTCIGIENCK